MPSDRSRFVLLCQQTLALGVVAAVTAPAANLVSIDIVGPAGAAGSAGPVAAPATAADASGGSRALVSAEPVRPSVRTVPLTGVSPAGVRALRRPSAPRRAAGAPAGAALASAPTAVLTADLAALSAPERVDGLATVGVTWAPGTRLPGGTITVSVRTERDGAWSGWTTVPYEEDEAPDPGSAEGREATPGTDPIYVGAVDRLQVKAVTPTGDAPSGMRIALVDPGASDGSTVAGPAIDTGGTASPASPASSVSSGSRAAAAALSAATVTPKPRIYSRAQWGADERMRDPASLHYGEVHGGFVHHTVNANGYTRAQVPAIIRGIYAYHTQSRGWSDIGYNFLVDRFGRIWEGRYGGVGRPVVGAHTLGYNDDAFAMSAIGNYDITRPSTAMLRAYGRLFAWKLGLHGVSAGSTHQWIAKGWFHAISGHRDAGQTACPGRYLYARLPTIRSLAAADQRGWAGRRRTTNLAGADAPDVVARDRTSKRVYLLRTGGEGVVAHTTATNTRFPSADLVLSAGDWDRDGHGDLVTRSGRTGRLYLYRGDGRGDFAAPLPMSASDFGPIRMLTAVGDMTGDGRPDLLGQRSGGSMKIYPGNGRHGFFHSYVAHSAVPGRQQVGVGLWTSDGAPDTVVRRSDHRLVLYPGNGPGGLTGGTVIGTAMPAFGRLVSVGDLTGDGRTDLLMQQRSDGRLWLRAGTAHGFARKHHFGTGTSRYDLVG